MVGPAALSRLYDALARWRWAARRWRGAAPGTGLELHKCLGAAAPGADAPPAGVAGLDPWLLQKIAPAPAGPVLDLGCGLGATLFAWARLRPGALVGLSSSPYSIARARAEAQRLGLAERCTFRTQSYDEPIAGRYAVVVAIESLLHAPDLERTLQNVAAAAVPGAVLVLCEDMLVAADDGADPDASALCRRWATARLHDAGTYRRALARAGFGLRQELDLTAQVAAVAPAELDRRERRLRFAGFLPVPWLRRVAEAYRGGVALERLYARGRMSYRTMIAVREPDGRP